MGEVISPPSTPETSLSWCQPASLFLCPWISLGRLEQCLLYLLAGSPIPPASVKWRSRLQRKEQAEAKANAKKRFAWRKWCPSWLMDRMVERQDKIIDLKYEQSMINLWIPAHIHSHCGEWYHVENLCEPLCFSNQYNHQSSCLVSQRCSFISMVTLKAVT